MQCTAIDAYRYVLVTIAGDILILGLNYKQEGTTYLFDDKPEIKDMILIPVKSNVEPTASSIAYSRGYLFIASAVHDSFLVRLSGIEHLPSVN